MSNTTLQGDCDYKHTHTVRDIVRSMEGEERGTSWEQQGVGYKVNPNLLLHTLILNYFKKFTTSRRKGKEKFPQWKKSKILKNYIIIQRKTTEYFWHFKKAHIKMFTFVFHGLKHKMTKFKIILTQYLFHVCKNNIP